MDWIYSWKDSIFYGICSCSGANAHHEKDAHQHDRLDMPLTLKAYRCVSFSPLFGILGFCGITYLFSSDQEGPGVFEKQDIRAKSQVVIDTDGGWAVNRRNESNLPKTTNCDKWSLGIWEIFAKFTRSH